MKVDEMNINIIRQLQDGRKLYTAIAEKLKVSHNTIRSRIHNMTEQGLLDVTGRVDPDKLHGHQVVMVGVKVNTMDLEEKGKEFSELKGVVSVAVVTGRYDLMLTALVNDDFELLDFFKIEMSRIQGVQSTETFVVFKNYNLKVPYVL
ncbi:MAG: Lrp/AsnC family transcriptional regulator [Desulfobacterales bacterium]